MFRVCFGNRISTYWDKSVSTQKSIKNLELGVPRLRPYRKITWKRLENCLIRSPNEESKAVWSFGVWGIRPSGFRTARADSKSSERTRGITRISKLLLNMSFSVSFFLVSKQLRVWVVFQPFLVFQAFSLSLSLSSHSLISLSIRGYRSSVICRSRDKDQADISFTSRFIRFPVGDSVGVRVFCLLRILSTGRVFYSSSVFILVIIPAHIILFEYFLLH